MKSLTFAASPNFSLSSLRAQVDVAPAARPKRRRVRTHRTETENCPTTRTPRRSTGGTGRRSPPSSCTSWRGRLRSRTTLTCTAARSWRSKSTCRRSECRCVRKAFPEPRKRLLFVEQQPHVESVTLWGVIVSVRMKENSCLWQNSSLNALKCLFGYIWSETKLYCQRIIRFICCCESRLCWFNLIVCCAKMFYESFYPKEAYFNFSFYLCDSEFWRLSCFKHLNAGFSNF